VSVMDGKLQQLTTATITITASATNTNILDGVFIAPAGLTPRTAIIKLKLLECLGSANRAPVGTIEHIDSFRWGD